MVGAVKNKHVWNSIEMDGILGCTNSVVITACSGNKGWWRCACIYPAPCLQLQHTGRKRKTHAWYSRWTQIHMQWINRTGWCTDFFFLFLYNTFERSACMAQRTARLEEEWLHTLSSSSPGSVADLFILRALCSCSSSGHPFLMLLMGFLNNAIYDCIAV